MMESTSTSEQPNARWMNAFTWGGTILMLLTYQAMTVGWMKVGPAFLVSQMVGEIAIVIVSVSKRAWQPAVVNIAFALASLIGLIRIFFFGLEMGRA